MNTKKFNMFTVKIHDVCCKNRQPFTSLTWLAYRKNKVYYKCSLVYFEVFHHKINIKSTENTEHYFK